MRITIWTLWATVALGILVVGPAQAQTPDNLDALRARALELVNQSRSESNAEPLRHGALLDAAAQGHAEDMLARNYYAHRSPEGDTVQDRFLGEGGSQWELVAENIAQCAGCGAIDIEQVRALHNDWMNSPVHRQNILASGLARFGFGIVEDNGQLYAVQTFAGPGQPRGLEPGEAAKPVALSAMTGVAMEALNSAREAEGVEPIEASAALEEAARILVPKDLEGFDLDAVGSAYSAVPRHAQSSWSSLSIIAGACGGCGERPTRADLESFMVQWLGEGSYRGTLLDPGFSAAGMVLRADSSGRKVALLVLGAGRLR